MLHWLCDTSIVPSINSTGTLHASADFLRGVVKPIFPLDRSFGRQNACFELCCQERARGATGLWIPAAAGVPVDLLKSFPIKDVRAAEPAGLTSPDRGLNT